MIVDGQVYCYRSSKVYEAVARPGDDSRNLRRVATDNEVSINVKSETTYPYYGIQTSFRRRSTTQNYYGWSWSTKHGELQEPRRVSRF